MSSRAIQLTFTRRDEHIYNELRKRVRVKKSVGVPSSMSFEAMRMIRLGYSREREEDIFRRAAEFGYLCERMSMFLPPPYVESFVEFVSQRYGAPAEMKGEYGRWMTPKGLLWIPVPEEEDRMVEVKCTDSELLNVLDADFMLLVREARNNEEKNES